MLGVSRSLLIIPAVIATLLGGRVAAGQYRGDPLPVTRADVLLDEGRWAEAESMFYQQSERAPRDPVARAALGRFIAMKGAVKTGMVLMEEARKFGLDATTTRDLIAPWRAIQAWRDMATEFRKDSTFFVRQPDTRDGLFQVALPYRAGESRAGGGVSELRWHEVVPRAVGIDSIDARGRPIGIEVFESMSPSLRVRDAELVLHVNARSALAATGRRYQVLRTPREVRVLIEDGRVLTLAAALRELSPSWWQLDLVHGVLVVR